MRRGRQNCLMRPLLRILGRRKCSTASSRLKDSLKSKLGLRQALRRFLEVESTPRMRSCEFDAFQREGLAVSTLRASSCWLRPTIERRLHSKLGVRTVVRLEMSAAMGRSQRGEGTQRQAARWLKKSGGSLELLMRMFLRRAKLWLTLGVSSNESSLQNCMLEIQLFDSPYHFVHIMHSLYPQNPFIPPTTSTLVQSLFLINFFLITATIFYHICQFLIETTLQKSMSWFMNGLHLQTQKTFIESSLKSVKIQLYFQLIILILKLLTQANHPLKTEFHEGWFQLHPGLLILISYSKQNLTSMQGCKISSENVANDREKVVEVKRKIGILKEALLIERQGNRQIEQQLYERGERLKKMELDSKKREEKNEGLLLEIRSLKDALIAERTEKQQVVQNLAQLQQQEKSENSGDNKKSLSSMFGWKSLFQK